MLELENKRVLVTGGSGFLGSHVVARLREEGCRQVFAPAHREYDLLDLEQVRRLYREIRPQVVVHSAALVGGIGANMARPGEFFYNNLVMGVQLIEQARLHGVEKFVALGTVCAYPKYTPVPFQEEDLWNGYPEETNAPYGLAKKMLLVQLQAYQKQYNFNGIYLLPVNLYGPGDNFDPASSHVIPAMIKKFSEASREGRAEVVLWGDGSPTREFLYVEDAAEGIVLAARRYDRTAPVNLGSGTEIATRDLANLIAALTGFQGKITWDTSKPNGQPRRRLDTGRATREFGFVARTSFREGLARTIEWYHRQLENEAPGQA